MNIKHKVYSLGVVAILGVVALLFSTSHFAQTTYRLNQANLLVAHLEVRLLNLRRNEKDFLLRKDLKYLDTFNKNMNIFLSTEEELSQILTAHELPSSQQLRKDILAYQQGFTALANGFNTLGLKPDANLQGKYYAQLYTSKANLTHQQLIELLEFDKKVQLGELDSSFVPWASDKLIASAQELVTQKSKLALSTM